MKKTINKALSWLLSVVMFLGLFVAANVSKMEVGAAQIFYWPLDTNHKITTGFYGYKDHNGCDMACASGTPIYATFAGTAVYYQKYTMINGVKTLTSFGNCVYLTSHDQKYVAIYAHMNAFEGFSLQIPSTTTKQQSGSSGTITIGSKTVSEGDVLGYVGKTGNATGNHLHYGLKVNGNFVDPSSYLNNSMSAKEHGHSQLPQKSVVSVSKSLLSLNENVTFYFSSDTGIKYAIGIDDEKGNRIETKEFTQSSYTRSFNKAGKYSCYISAYNNYGALDSSRIYFTVYDTKPKKSVVSTNKSSYGLNENVTFNFSSDTGTKYAIGIDDEKGNRIETKEFTKSSYTRSFSKAGKYSCYISTYNNYGVLDSSRIYFTVEDKKPKKSVVSMSKKLLSLNENVTFYFSSDNGTKYAIGIDDENGNRVETKEFTQSSYTRSFSKAGKYSCYISTYNNYGALDSSRIYFTVYDKKPQKSVVSISKNLYSLNENITFNFSSDTGIKYAIGIDDEKGNRIETKEFTQSSYTRSFNKEGKYSCYISTYNNYGALDSCRIYFTVTDKHIVSYNMNGGSGSIGNQTKTYGQDLTLSSTKPTRTGYEFVGWNTNASATTAQYQAGGKYTANSGATLYAIWKAKQVTVTFYRNQNGSDNTTATQTFTYGVNNQSFGYKNWSKDGYTLLGWSENRNATDKQYSTNSGVDWNWIAQRSPKVTVYAVWKANTYTISYNMNGGSGSIGNQIKTCGQDLTLSTTIPTRTDYQFIGWSTDKNATTAQYQAGGKYTANSNATLYAVWKVNHSYATKIIAPTCTEQGYTLHTCTNCGDSYKDTYINATGHDFEEWIVIKVPTSTEVGEEQRTCSICEAVEKRSLELKHIPGDINNDGKVNNKDFSRLFQYLSGWDVEVNEAALDVNGDGSVNNKDATRLFQYVSGWNVDIY